jgi:undecaprenyl diphosphate synthase
LMKDLFEVLKPGSKDWALANSIDPNRLPAHVAIIMDGNGRWARKRSLPRAAGHKAGVEAVRITVETCKRLGIQALTLYAFSVENWKRPRAEVDTLWRLLRVYLRRELPEILSNGIRFTCIGRLDGLPPQVRQELQNAIDATAHNRGMQLNVAINYSGRAELVDAINAIVEDARLEGRLRDLRIDEEAIASRLYTADLPDPDLLIRTSGEMRISNFLLWQIAYAELYVTDTLWPDFRRADLMHAILDYQKRDRRFGGLSPEGERANSDESVEAVGTIAR